MEISDLKIKSVIGFNGRIYMLHSLITACILVTNLHAHSQGRSRVPAIILLAEIT